MSTSKIKSKATLPVTIISWLMLFAGLSNSLGTLWGVWSLTFLSDLGERIGIEEIGAISNITTINSINFGIAIVSGIGLIIVSYGIGNMRRWALYGFTVLTIITATSLAYSYKISPEQNLNVVFSPVIQALILIYLWSISKKFV